MTKRLTRSFIMIFFALIMTLPSYHPVSAGADTTAPKVNSITIETSQAKPGEKIKVSLDVTEEETGISQIAIFFFRHNGKSLKYMNTILDTHYSSGQYTGQITLESTLLANDGAGDYYLGSIQIHDFAGNVSWYTNPIVSGTGSNNGDASGYYVDNNQAYLFKDGTSEHCKILGSRKIAVQNDTDNEPPVVKKMWLENNRIKRGGLVTVHLQVSEKSEISEIWLYVKKKGDTSGAPSGDNFYIQGNIERNKDNLVFQAKMPDYLYSGEYCIREIYIIDKYTNASSLTYNSDTGDYDSDTSGSYLTDYETGEYCYVSNPYITVDDEAKSDTIAPKIKSVSVRNRTVQKPGLLYVDFEAEDNAGVSYVQVDFTNIKTGDSICNYVNLSGKPYENGSITLMIPSNLHIGDYQLTYIIVEDTSHNTVYYTTTNSYTRDANGKEISTIAYFKDEYGQYLQSENAKYYITEKNKVTVEEEFDVSFEQSLSNPKLLNSVVSMKDSTAAKINIDSNGTAEKALFKAIQGTDKTLIFYSQTYQWIFKGKDIVTPKDINLTAEIRAVDGSGYGCTGKLLEITFPDNGVLPGPSQFRLKSDYISKMYDLTGNLYLYYVNTKTNSLELESGSHPFYLLDGSNHWCIFTIDHNSSFLTTGQKIKNSKLSIKSVKTSGAKTGTVLTDKATQCLYTVTTQNKEVAFSGVKSPKTTVKIPDKIKLDGRTYQVTSIKKNALKGDKTVKKVIIGSNVRTIGNSAFMNCKRLNSVSIGKNVIKIGTSAFSGDTRLVTVTFGKQLSTIGSKAFYKCSSIKKLTIPGKVIKIGSSAFQNCKKLSRITIQSKKLTTKKVGAKAWKGISQKAVIKVPKSVLKSYRKWIYKKGPAKKVTVKS